MNMLRGYKMSSEDRLIKIQEVPDSKWDVLIILDACRYDVFEYLNDIPGTLEKRASKNTTTYDWIQANFKKAYPDILYISGNPMVSKFKLSEFKADTFIDIEPVWDYGWDEKLKAVPPEPVTDASIKLINKDPSLYKRFIVHYLQPHTPYLKNPKTHIGRGMLWEFRESKENRSLPMSEVNKMGPTLLYYARSKFTDEELRIAYFNNVLYVLEEVKRLLKNIPKDKEVIISSDHGECLGYEEENMLWGHAPNLPYMSARIVPWFRVDMSAI